jgi:hypothetical protein
VVEKPAEEVGGKYRYSNQIVEDVAGNASEGIKNIYRF